MVANHEDMCHIDEVQLWYLGSAVAQWESAWLETEGPRVRASSASLRCGPWSRHIYPSSVLVQPRKTRPYITERLLMGRKESNKQTNNYGTYQEKHCPLGCRHLTFKIIYYATKTRQNLVNFDALGVHVVIIPSKWYHDWTDLTSHMCRWIMRFYCLQTV